MAAFYFHGLPIPATRADPLLLSREGIEGCGRAERSERGNVAAVIRRWMDGGAYRG